MFGAGKAKKPSPPPGIAHQRSPFRLGQGDSHSRLGPFGRSRAEGAAGRQGPVLAGAIAIAAARVPAAAPAQCGPTVLDLRHSHDGLDFCALQVLP
jgi:hypothetical protein